MRPWLPAARQGTVAVRDMDFPKPPSPRMQGPAGAGQEFLRPSFADPSPCLRFLSGQKAKKRQNQKKVKAAAAPDRPPPAPRAEEGRTRMRRRGRRGTVRKIRRGRRGTDGAGEGKKICRVRKKVYLCTRIPSGRKSLGVLSLTALDGSDGARARLRSNP